MSEDTKPLRECDPEIKKKGQKVFEFKGLTHEQVDEVCENLAKATKFKVDRHWNEEWAEVWIVGDEHAALVEIRKVVPALLAECPTMHWRG